MEKKLTCVGNLVSLHNPKIWKNRIKIINATEQNGSRMKHFDSLNEMTYMRHCISGLSNREVTMHQSVAFLS